MTTTHDTPTSAQTTDLVPGRVYWVGYGSEHAPRTPDGNERTWLYLVAIVGDVLFGVAFANLDRHRAAPIGVSVPTSAVLGQLQSGGGYSHHTPTIVGWWPDMLADYFRATTGSAATTTTSGANGHEETPQEAYRRGVNDGRREANATFDAWKARAEEIAHEYADRNELCSEFDRCMEEVGLSPRGGHTYDVTYRVTVPRGTDPYDLDAEDLYERAEEGAGSPWNVVQVD